MKKIIKYIVPAIITFIILGILFYCNKLFPFGMKPLIQNDADYLYIPVLYKLYDIFHYGESIFYDDIGLGNSIFASLITQGSLFSILNILLLFIKRSFIIYFFNIFIILKMCLVSLSIYFYIEKKYKNIHYNIKLFFSIMYTFSGFFAFHYYNEIWLDIIILFPLLMHFLDKLLNGDSEIGYIIILAISFIITFYYSYFVIVFVLLYSFIMMDNKKNKKEIIFTLGKSTLIAFLISSFSSIPLLYQIFISDRFNYSEYISLFNNIELKSLYLFFNPLFVILFIKLLLKYKNDKSMILKYCLLFILYIVPIIFDPINAVLHGGSYWFYPYRYGFITSFILLDACLYYINNSKNKNKNITFSSFVIIFLVFILIALCTYLNHLFRGEIISGDTGILLNIDDINIYLHVIYMLLVVYLMYFLIMLLKNIKLKYTLICVVSIYSIFLMFSWTMYYNPTYHLSSDIDDLYNNFEIDSSSRLKLDYKNYLSYPGFVLNSNTLDNWLHVIPNGQNVIFEKLGYHIFEMMAYSHGGTIFSDWLLNFHYVITDKKIDNDSMYTYIDSYNDKFLYKYNYNFSNGIVIKKLINDFNIFDKFEYQNELYKQLFNTEDNIINISSYNIGTQSGVINIHYDINGEGYLYFYSSLFDYIDYIVVNDKKYYFEDDFEGYIRNFGYFSSDIDFSIYLIDSNEIYYNFPFELGFIDKNDILALNTKVKYENNKYYIDGNYGEYLFLPINNIPGLSVYNNNKKVESNKCLDNFICVKLYDGENVISIKYNQPYLLISVILSCVGFIFLLLCKKIRVNNFVLNLAFYLYYGIAILFIFYAYIYSVLKIVL